ncbi:MAG: cytochrome c biogenesis protein CcdA [Polyangia bacterium]|jgi:cytochrome c biogenesis protein CcdA|nr:cytochrome c biogenesis protein CcdA [Polyangia bacterium]
MFESFLADLGQTIQANPWMAVVAVFLGGVLTATNPCVLAMIPLMISFVSGRREEGMGPLRALGYSSVFVVGLCATFTVLGVMAALSGSMYGGSSPVWNWIVAGVCILMGLHLMGLLPFQIPSPIKSQPKLQGVLGALLLGLLFGFVSLPCAGPILIVVLTYLAGSDSSIAYGGLLLFVYGLGHSVLVLVAGVSMGLARKLIESQRVTKVTERLRQIAGVLIIGVGGYFAFLALK